MLGALNMAIWQRRPEAVIHHSDQGSTRRSSSGDAAGKHVCGPRWAQAQSGMPTMCCESFFATLKCELLERKPFRNPAEAKMAVFDFIEGWHNP